MAKMFDGMIQGQARDSIALIIADLARADVMRFDVSDLWAGLPEDEWQATVLPLLETTPCRPVYPDSWWEWTLDTPGYREKCRAEGVQPGRLRFGVLLMDCSIEESMRYLRVGVQNPEELELVRQEAIAESVDRIVVGVILAQRPDGIFLIGIIGISLNAEGRFIRKGEGFMVVGNTAMTGLRPPKDRDPEALSEKGVLVNTAWQVAYFNAMLHVRNIIPQRHEIPAKMNAARVRRGKMPLNDFHTLHIVTPAQARAHAHGVHIALGSETRAHMVRGFYRTYTEERPMLGKPYGVGTFFTPAFTRGSKALGTADKDYRVSPRTTTKGEGR